MTLCAVCVGNREFVRLKWHLVLLNGGLQQVQCSSTKIIVSGRLLYMQVLVLHQPSLRAHQNINHPVRKR